MPEHELKTLISQEVDPKTALIYQQAAKDMDLDYAVVAVAGEKTGKNNGANAQYVGEGKVFILVSHQEDDLVSITDLVDKVNSIRSIIERYKELEKDSPDLLKTGVLQKVSPGTSTRSFM